MVRIGSASRLFCLTLCAGLALPAAHATPLRIAGLGANVGSIELLVTEYRKVAKDTRFAPVETVGSGGAIRALNGGKLDLALLSRTPKDSETGSGAAALVAVEYARTPFVVAVHADTPTDAMTGAQLAEFLSGDGTWPDGKRARPILRPSDDTDVVLLRKFAQPVSSALDRAYSKPGMPMAATDREAAELIERTPGALGASTLSLILSESRRIKPVVIDGNRPSVAALESGAYPHYKRLYIVHGANASQEAKKFVAFLATPPAKQVLKKTGHVVPPFKGN
jgi:phosphate transport system substrate-binding protein